MGTYKNDYTKSEDETLWELHEIRHKLYKELKSKPLSQINEEALKKFQNWQKENQKIGEKPLDSSQAEIDESANQSLQPTSRV